MKGITHREAAVLLECPSEEVKARIFDLAKKIKLRFYGNRIVMFAPLYLSNYCVNGCVYCPYHGKNKHIARKKLTQEEIRREVIALQDMGHKRLAIESGEDPQMNPIEIHFGKHPDHLQHPSQKRRHPPRERQHRRDDGGKLPQTQRSGIGTYILFQETYHKETYEQLHPTGPKHNYAYHTEAMDRAMEGGIDDVGLGVLYGLNLYRYDFVGQIMHAEHLEAVHGVGPHTISVPRICPADDIDVNDFSNAVPNDLLKRSSPSSYRRAVYRHDHLHP